jgi:hypothetical protein
MRRCHILLSRCFLPLLLLVLGCGASIDPTMQASVDRQVAALRPQSTTYPALAEEMPPPFRTGQWIRLKMIDADKRPAFLTYKVVGQVGSAYWVEVVNESYTGRTVMKMLADFGDRTDPEKIEIQNIILKTRDHEPIDYSQQGPVLAMVKGLYKKVIKDLVISWHGLPKETKLVIGGTFTDCFKGVSEVSLAGMTTRGTVWHHAAVPINGVVAFEGEKGDSEELVAFGMTGAVSEL